MKDIDLAGSGRKNQKKHLPLDMNTEYSLMQLKHQRIETDQLDKDKYVTMRRVSHTH